METLVESRQRLRFGPFEFDLRTKELFRNGSKLKIHGHPIAVLELLLERPGELVTREEMRRTLWPDDTFVDFEHSLNSTIGRLRDALRDTAERPHYVETLPRLGYRFIAEIEPEKPPPGPAVSTANEPAHATTHPLLLRSWKLLLAAFLIGGAAGLVWNVRRPLPMPHVNEIRQITRDVRWRYKSPLGLDGSQLYLMGEASGLLEVPATGGEVKSIPLVWPETSDMALVPGEFSPDGAYLLCTVMPDDRRVSPSIWVFSITGSPVRYLAHGLFAGWSPDGKNVIYSTEEGKVSIISSSGGESRPLFSFAVGIPSRFSWSPDGKRIRFSTGTMKIWEVASDGTDLREFLPGMAASVKRCCGRWTPDGSFYIFAATRSSSADYWLNGYQLWALDERPGKLRKNRREPVQLTSEPLHWAWPLISRDGTTVFATGTISQGELVRLEPRTGQFTRHLGGVSAEWLGYSADGRYVAYVSFPDHKIWRANRDGTGKMLLAEPQGLPFGLRWSPDGGKILFVEGVAASTRGEVRHRTVYILPSQGGMPQQVQFPSGENPADVTWSPDGKRLAYSVDPWEPGPDGIRILDLATRQSSALPAAPTPVYSPVWSPDGRYIFSAAEQQAGAAIFDLEKRTWKQLPGNVQVSHPSWTHDGRLVYFLGSNHDIFQGIYRISVPGGRIELVRDLADFRQTGSGGDWLGLDPEDHPLLLQDAGSVEIYALTLALSR